VRVRTRRDIVLDDDVALLNTVGGNSCWNPVLTVREAVLPVGIDDSLLESLDAFCQRDRLYIDHDDFGDDVRSARDKRLNEEDHINHRILLM